MIQEIRIHSLQDLMPLITDQEFRPELQRNRSSFLYRGMEDASFRMYTSLSRNCKHLQAQLEPAILENYAKYAVISDPSISTSVWHQMISGQHNGLPTRLLDWTHSALVSLHFAVTESNLADMNAHDCLVWRIDIHELFSLLPEQYRKATGTSQSTIFSVDSLSRVTGSLQQYDRDMADHAMVIIEPPSINQRIVNQYSFFSVVPLGMTDIEGFLNTYTSNTVKYIIDKDLRWRIRDMLDQLNMSERTVYPGLDGLSRWIARHYYVK